MLASAEGASGKNLECSMWILRKNGLVHHCFGKKCTKQAFSECFGVTAHEPRGFGARLPNLQKMFASAEGASGEKLRHSMRGLCKCALSRHCACLANNAQDEQYIEVAPKSLIHESIHGVRALPEQSENDARERQRRERRKFGAFYASFTQKWLLRHCTWQKLYKTGSTLRMIQSHSFTNTCVLRAPPQQRKTMLVSAEGASGENLEHSVRVLRKSAFCTTVLGTKCTKHTMFGECSKVANLRTSWFCARL